MVLPLVEHFSIAQAMSEAWALICVLTLVSVASLIVLIGRRRRHRPGHGA